MCFKILLSFKSFLLFLLFLIHFIFFLFHQCVQRDLFLSKTDSKAGPLMLKQKLIL